MRESGYYWVSLNHQWTIARWTNKVWLLFGSTVDYSDEWFDVIVEKRILKD